MTCSSLRKVSPVLEPLSCHATLRDRGVQKWTREKCDRRRGGGGRGEGGEKRGTIAGTQLFSRLRPHDPGRAR